MGVSREEEFEHQHKGNSKIHHLSPSAHGIEGPNGRYIYMRMRMFVRGNTNNFQRGFSQHAPPAILNYLKKKKKRKYCFISSLSKRNPASGRFGEQRGPTPGLGKHAVTHGNQVYTKTRGAKGKTWPLVNMDLLWECRAWNAEFWLGKREGFLEEVIFRQSFEGYIGFCQRSRWTCLRQRD